MSFIISLKRVFGFESETFASEDAAFESGADEPQYRDASVVPLKEQHMQHEEDAAALPTGEEVTHGTVVADEVDEEQDSKLLEIFDGVLAIFNEALPQFIRDSIDPEAQRRYLYEALQGSVESYIESLAKDARDKAMSMDRKERQRLQADLQSLREREKQAEQVIAEQQTKQLSAQRQKRALTQKIENHEKKIAALEAEKEQSDLQIRSLVNKLKVAEVKDGDMSAQRDEIEELRKDVSAKNVENVRLTKQLEQQAREIADLKKELDESHEQIGNAAMMQMSDEDRKLIMEVQSEMAKFEEVKKAKDSKISSQKKQIAELSGQISAQTSQLEQAQARVAELEAQLVALQGMLQDMQSNSALEQSLRERQEMIPEANEEDAVSASDSDDVESADSASATKRSRSKRKAKPKISAIDENLESVNWLLTVPSDENPAPSVGAPSSDADFGYQPPVKKEIAANDAQLTLF